MVISGVGVGNNIVWFTIFFIVFLPPCFQTASSPQRAPAGAVHFGGVQKLGDVDPLSDAPKLFTHQTCMCFNGTSPPHAGAALAGGHAAPSRDGPPV
jgi:hypothetical protein